jgi:hypothetical protein
LGLRGSDIPPPGWEIVQKFYNIEHNMYCHDLGDPLKWKAAPSDLTSLLHYPDATLNIGHVLVVTGQVDHISTWNRLNQRLQGRGLAVGLYHCDVKTTLEIILINLL